MAGFPHWELLSVSALCRLQGAGPDLLSMVVLAVSRVRRSQIIQSYNRLIGKRFILIYAIFYCVAFASLGSARYCRSWSSRPVFLFVFFIRNFSSKCDVAFSRAAQIRARVSLYPASTCFSVRGLGPLYRRFLFLFVEDFSACVASDSAPAVSSLRQGVWRGCVPFFSGSFLRPCSRHPS